MMIKAKEARKIAFNYRKDIDAECKATIDEKILLAAKSGDYEVYDYYNDDISYIFMDDYSKHLETLGYSVHLFDDGYVIRW